MLDEPVLYLSLYLKQNRQIYYELLQEVRIHGAWETWLEFFLQSIYSSAKHAISTANSINILFKQDLAKIATLGRARFSCVRLLDYLKHLPQVTVSLVKKRIKFNGPNS